MTRWTIGVAAAVAAALLALPLAFSAPSPAGAAACASPGYRYVGFAQTAPARSVSATVAALARPRVRSGHVAAWVGVGDRRAWLQVGLAAFPRSPLRLYYEVRVPGSKRRYVELGDRVGPARRLAVAAVSPGWWQVFLDGRAATAPVYLPGSEAGLPLVATAETWSEGRGGCNEFRFRFDRVSVSGERRLGRAIGSPQSFVAAGA